MLSFSSRCRVYCKLTRKYICDLLCDLSDLFVSRWRNKVYQAPKNLGAMIDTKDAEFCPFVHQGRLYLSRQIKGNGRFIENIYSYPFLAEKFRKR
jgi:hypothetical protein